MFTLQHKQKVLCPLGGITGPFSASACNNNKFGQSDWFMLDEKTASTHDQEVYLPGFF